MASTSRQALPQASGFVNVKLLDGGSFSASWDKVHAGAKDIPFRMYIWSFYIYNAAHDRRILWDVGVTSNKTDYSNFVQDYIWEELQPVGPTRSIQEQLLRRENLRTDDVDAIIFSHAHWDHSRPIRDSFPRAIGYFGPDTQEYCSPGHLETPSMQWDGRFFDPVNASERWETLNGPWTSFGPFERAMDFFGDGSFWVIQAPGHMPGNLCAAAKLEGGEWVLLGSDCCHSRLVAYPSLSPTQTDLCRTENFWTVPKTLLSSIYQAVVKLVYRWIYLRLGRP